jgi:hypothetical protein
MNTISRRTLPAGTRTVTMALAVTYFSRSTCLPAMAPDGVPLSRKGILGRHRI